MLLRWTQSRGSASRWIISDASAANALVLSEISTPTAGGQLLGSTGVKGGASGKVATSSGIDVVQSTSV